jgi:fructose/tagatose bisphosphate aldolase
VRDLIREAIAAGFYNIDIDSSTVVDLSKPTITEQQRNNFAIAADLTALIRRLEPKGITISVGGEIGEVGGKNSTVEELRCFMDHFLEELEKKGKGLKGISKMSVQTGTSHGGVVLPDGTIAKVSIDFDTLERISRAAREKYGLAGAVQHGASTLPDEAFDKFPRTGTAEIHLATGFQNIILDSSRFPAGLREKLYRYVKTKLADERSAKDTEEQFIYKTRKKIFGPFKPEMWNLPSEIRREIGRELEEKFLFLFGKLNVFDTAEIVTQFVMPVDVPSTRPHRERAADRPSSAERYDEGE